LKCRTGTRQKRYSIEVMEIIRCVAMILYDYIKKGDEMKEFTEHTYLFDEKQFANMQWNVGICNGFSSTLPTIRYHVFRQQPKIKPVTMEAVHLYMREIFDKVHPSFECSIIALVYIEKLMVLLLKLLIACRIKEWQ